MQIPAEPQTIDEALEWHGAIVDSVLHHKATVLAAYHSGSHLPPRFYAMSYDEIDAFFVAEREEVDAYAIVAILGAAEASIREDYFERVAGNFKDLLSRTYAAFYRKLPPYAKSRPPFDDRGILDELKASGVIAAHLISDFRGVLLERHWYAHGRYWILKIGGHKYSPSDAHAIANALLSALPP